jgi:hypothetical protein
MNMRTPGTYCAVGYVLYPTSPLVWPVSSPEHRHILSGAMTATYLTVDNNYGNRLKQNPLLEPSEHMCTLRHS